MFDRVLKMLLTGNVLTHLIRYYLFKASITTSGRGSYKHFFWLKQVNASWLAIIDLEKNIDFSLSLTKSNKISKTNVKRYLARLTAGM